MTLTSVQADHYRIPLPVPLSDATHGEITHFELVTVRLATAEGPRASVIPTPSAPAGRPSMP